MPLEQVNASGESGIISGSSESDEGFGVEIRHNNGIITKITAIMLDWVGGFPVPESQKTGAFLIDARKRLGIPENK